MTGSKTLSLAERENSEASIEKLRASTSFYGYAKMVLAVQMILATAVPVGLSITASIAPDFKIWAACVSLSIALIDTLLLERLQTVFRKQGARVQELFDSDLLQIEWNKLRCGDKLEPEAVHKAAAHCKPGKDDSRFRDWYPVAFDQLPAALGRVLCQRACLWWDTTQRRVYAHWILGIVLTAVFIMTLTALAMNQTVAGFVLGVYAPLAPALLWGVREARRHYEAATALEKARGHVDKLWTSALSGEMSFEKLWVNSRQVQDALFDGRVRNPLLFNWIYRVLRSENEDAMKLAAEGLVAEALAARGKWGKAAP